MREDLEQLKQRIPLLQYLQRRHWTGCRVATREELFPWYPDHAVLKRRTLISPSDIPFATLTHSARPF